MSPELFTSLGAMIVGVIGAVTSLFLALRKRIAEEDVPALKRRVEDLEQLRKADRLEYERRLAEAEQLRERDRNEYQREINETRAEVLALDRRYYELQRYVVSEGVSVPDNLRRLGPRPSQSPPQSPPQRPPAPPTGDSREEGPTP